MQISVTKQQDGFLVSVRYSSKMHYCQPIAPHSHHVADVSPFFKLQTDWVSYISLLRRCLGLKC